MSACWGWLVLHTNIFLQLFFFGGADFMKGKDQQAVSHVRIGEKTQTLNRKEKRLLCAGRRGGLVTPGMDRHVVPRQALSAHLLLWIQFPPCVTANTCRCVKSSFKASSALCNCHTHTAVRLCARSVSPAQHHVASQQQRRGDAARLLLGMMSKRKHPLAGHQSFSCIYFLDSTRCAQ